MSNEVITIDPGDDLAWLVEQIQDDKIARIENMPPVDMHLTRETAYAYLQHSCLLEHELIALLFGMIPHPTETADEFSCMEPDDNMVVRRLLADKRAGKLTFPMRVDEAIEYLTPWRSELPDELASAIDEYVQARAVTTGGAVSDENSLERKNSSASAVAETRRVMSQGIHLLEAAGLSCSPALPGSKQHYCEYLRRHSDRLSSLADETLHDYLKQCGYGWERSGGSRHKTDESIRNILRVPAVEAPMPLPSVAVKSTSHQNWLDKVPAKT